MGFVPEKMKTALSVKRLSDSLMTLSKRAQDESLRPVRRVQCKKPAAAQVAVAEIATQSVATPAAAPITVAASFAGAADL
jgi:hypothetical protein